MAKRDINEKPFDEGTLTKLDLFQLYTREWLPVFLAPHRILWPHVHLFDFFCGSGSDSVGVAGSPIRILEELEKQQQFVDRGGISVAVHFSDEDAAKIERLRSEIRERKLVLENVTFEVEPGEFKDRFPRAQPILASDDTANLVILDQYGIKDVTEDVFRFLVGCRTTDVLFFISSSILRRLNAHPNIEKYLKLERAEDSHDAHRAVASHFRKLVPAGTDYYIAPFSIRKSSNVYGVIFGTGHPLGMEKFLRVAWKTDELNGEADFDINREGLSIEQPTLGFDEFRPTKITVFEGELEQRILHGKLAGEGDIYRFCLREGVTPSHAEPVLSKLKKGGRLKCAWRVPHIDSLKSPRPMELL